MSNRRTGPISAQEAHLIRTNVGLKTYGEIALLINRTEAAVHKWVRNNLPREVAVSAAPAVNKDEIKSNLRRNLKWQYLREELTIEEVSYFEEQYACYVQQFKDDVLPSEEDQIFNLIKLDIAVHRNRRDVRLYREERVRLEDEYRSLPPRLEMADEDRARTAEIDLSLGNLQHAETARTSEYLKLSSELQSLQSDLKATRAQRVNKIDSFKESWTDVLKKLQEEEYQATAGTYAELSRLASDKEERRLTAWHKFADDKLDQPLLTAETALEEN